MPLATGTGPAGYGTVDDTGETDLLNISAVPANACMSLWIKCSPNSTNSLLVGIQELHGSSITRLEAGDELVFRASSRSYADRIRNVTARAIDVSSEADFAWAKLASAEVADP